MKNILNIKFVIIALCLFLNNGYSQLGVWNTFFEDRESIGGLAFQEDTLWVADGSFYLFKLNMVTNEEFLYKLPEDGGCKIAIDKSGNKWIVTGYDGIIKFDGINSTVYNKSNSDLPDDMLQTIIIDSQDIKWIGTSFGGLVKFDNITWTTYNKSNSLLPNNFIQSISIDNKGNKWIGTSDGLTKYDDVEFSTYNPSNSDLPSDLVDEVIIDSQDGKWIGLRSHGVVHFDDNNWTIYNTSNSGLPSNKIEAIAIDKKGNKWISTVKSGVAKFDGTNWTVYDTSNSGLQDNYILEIAIDSSDNKWFAGWEKGVGKLSNTTSTPITHSILKKSSSMKNLRIYNSHSVLKITLPDIEKGKLEISIFNLKGRLVKKEICYPNKKIFENNCSNLQVGLYLIKLTNGTNTFESKIIIK